MNKKFSFQPETVVIQKKGFVTAEMDGETAMMSIDRGKYYSLDLVGSRIWEIITKPMAVGEVINILMVEYEVEIDTCERDVNAFLEKMYAEGLVEFV